MPTLDASTLLLDAPHGCSICRARHLSYFGSKDFGHAGNDHFSGSRTFADYGVLIPYFQCRECGFVFTQAFDAWSPEDFVEHIYNDDYHLSDPPFLDIRPAGNARMIWASLRQRLQNGALLDFGGGNGSFARHLRRLGAEAYSFDPHFGQVDEQARQRTFDVVTSFEVIEHVPHRGQHGWMQQLADFMREDGRSLAVISTETVPVGHDIHWWYICPRNGHISLHSPQSLARLAAASGLQVSPIQPGLFALAAPGCAGEVSRLIAGWQTTDEAAAAH
nr:class I SAM-dependent methyltransferase [Chromobacterium sp. ASV5]